MSWMRFPKGEPRDGPRRQPAINRYQGPIDGFRYNAASCPRELNCDSHAFAGVDCRRRRVGSRVAARLGAPVRVCCRGFRVCRSVSLVGVRQSNELSHPRHRDAWDDGSGASTGTVEPATGDSDCVHYQRRPDDPPASPRARRRRVPVQAVQRDSSARRAQRRPEDEVNHDAVVH
jgi:hypothetical protein